MHHIRTTADLSAVREAVSKPVFSAVSAYLEELFTGVDWPEGMEPVLDAGHIVILDSKRDDWRTVLNPCEPWTIEYVERLTTRDAADVYKVVKLLDNDFIMTYFVEAGSDEGLDAWLDSLAED